MEVQKVNYRRRTSGSKEDREVLRRRRASEGSGVAANWRASMVEVSSAVQRGGVAR